MSEQGNEQQQAPQQGASAPPSVPPITPPDADVDAPEPVGQTPETVNPEGDDAIADEDGTAPTEPGDEGVPFRPSSDFEEAAE